MILRIAYALGALALLSTASAQNSTGGTRWIVTTDPVTNKPIYLDDNRQPALYTSGFGDCLGGSSVNVSRFDVAYYKDNSTILFHLQGSSQLHNADVMLYIGVYAYGKSRFDKPFSPCQTNIDSLCPINSSVPISANGRIAISADDAAQIPDIALSIPDFEGEAILRIFSNVTQDEVACYSAQITNGGSFSQPAAVGSVLGIFTFIAMIASFATAAYGEVVPTMRLHYAHSLSVGVVFAVWQHIFFTGALSMNWPSVLPAWWSNFAWAGGMIYTSGMQQSISNFIGANIGSTTSVGAAAAGTDSSSVGGGYNPKQIYGRGLDFANRVLPADHPIMRDVASELYGFDAERVQRALSKRDFIPDYSTGYKWYGGLVGQGLPLPGNYSGFAGTLAPENIPIANAFMTGFLWLLIFLVIITGTVILFKFTLELLSRMKWMKQDRMAFFRQHWISYTAAAALRTLFVAWFMIMFLATFQFTIQSSAGVKAIAAIVFIILLLALPAIAIYALMYKAKRDGSTNELGEHRNGRGILARLPFRKPRQLAPPNVESQYQNPDVPAESKSSSKPFWKRVPSRMSIEQQENEYSVHDDEEYIKKFGWLASRYRRTKWWFFPYWLIYEFIRACFYGGASGHPLVQVFGLLVVEFIAFGFLLWSRPFESKRLNILVVYLLGFSKVACVALSAAFDIQFNIDRIIATAIGIIIIVIQGILMIITLIAIVAGAWTSYMSVTRNAKTFRPRKYTHLREKYFDHLDRTVNDLPPEPKPKKEKKPKPEPKVEVAPVEPYFEMKTMRRMGKIDDEDNESAIAEGFISRTSLSRPNAPYMDSRPGSQSVSPINRSRAASASSQNFNHGSLPFGARPHKASWSTRDFDSWNKNESWNKDGSVVQSPIDMSRNLAEDESIPPTVPKHAHMRKNSKSSQHSHQSRLRPQISSDSLQVGGEISTREMVGKVPQPVVRARAGSAGRNLPTFANQNLDVFNDNNDTVAGARKGKHPALTPAQEAEEFNATYFDRRQPPV